MRTILILITMLQLMFVGGVYAADATVGLKNFKVFAANDLGMHCVDKDYSVLSILPPFNVVS